MAVLADLERLIAFETVSHLPTDPLAAWLAERLEGLGGRVLRFPDPTTPGKANLVASFGPVGTDGLALSGHMDVVPTEGQAWASDPFVMTRRGDRLFGRGTADMKGFIAATLAALERLRGATFRRELLLLWTYDEEVGCMGSAHLAEQWTRDGPAPSWCIVGEPTDFQMLRMHPGHAAITIRIEGVAAHSSRPDLGRNAIEGSAAVVDVLRQVARELERECMHEDLLERPWVTMNVAGIRGGRAINIVPDFAEIDVGFRPLPGMRADGITARIRDALDTAKDARLRDLSTTIVAGPVVPSLLTPEGTALQSWLTPHASSPTTAAASFATDAGNLERLGTQCLVFGPGSIEVAHKPDEFVEIGALHRAVGVLTALIQERCLSI